MSRWVMALILAAIGATGCSRPETRAPVRSPIFHGPREVLIQGQHTVDLMEPTASPRAVELGNRFIAAVRRDPEWWKAQIAASKPGEPLPWDSRLGMTREEYTEYLASAGKIGIRKKGEATLGIAMPSKDVFILNGDSELFDMTGIAIDLVADHVRTPFGTATERSDVDVDDTSPLGAWRGVMWKYEAADSGAMTGTIAKLAVGKLRASGRGVIYYDVKSIRSEGNVRISRILNFDLPATP